MELNKIYNMDCLKGMKQLEDNSVDLIVTDPPYGINFQSNHRKDKFDYIENDDNLDFLDPFVKESYRVLKDNTHFYCFCRWDVYHRFYEVISKYFKIKNCLIVKRENTSMGDLEGSFAYFYAFFAHFQDLVVVGRMCQIDNRQKHKHPTCNTFRDLWHIPTQPGDDYQTREESQSCLYESPSGHAIRCFQIYDEEGNAQEQKKISPTRFETEAPSFENPPIPFSKRGIRGSLPFPKEGTSTFVRK